MKNIILLLRPEQWIKNLFIFLPLFFDRHLLDLNYICPSFAVFIAYSFIASSIYCFNDIWDVESDRKHPKKCKRPIASGSISVFKGYMVMFSMFLLSMFVIFLTFMNDINTMIQVASLIILYFVLNVFYCLKLKHIAILDVFIISFGFVLRVLVGGVTSQIWISHWIILMTFLLALFLAFAKRRDDVVLYKDTGKETRENVNRYSLDFMNQSISIIAAITIVCYIMYTVSPEVIRRMGTSNLYITSIWVLLGIMRYLQITIVDVRSGSPTKVILHDSFLKIVVLCWFINFIFIIYF